MTREIDELRIRVRRDLRGDASAVEHLESARVGVESRLPMIAVLRAPRRERSREIGVRSGRLLRRGPQREGGQDQESDRTGELWGQGQSASDHFNDADRNGVKGRSAPRSGSRLPTQTPGEWRRASRPGLRASSSGRDCISGHVGPRSASALARGNQR